MTNKIKHNLIKLSFLFLSFYSLNSKIEIKLETSGLENLPNETMPTGYIGETFQIKVKVKNGGRNSSEINVKGLDKFNIEGTSSSSSTTIINNKYESEITYIYDLNTDKEGAFEIGPAKIKRGGKTIKSNPAKINFKITKRKGGDPNQNISGTSSEHDFFCILETNKTSVFVGEPIILKFKAYGFGNIVQAGFPPFKIDDFSVKEIGEIKQGQEKINGKAYVTLEKQLILFPSSPGNKEISSLCAIYQVQKRHSLNRFDNDVFFQNFFQPRLETKKVFSDRQEIEVMPLPKYKNKVDGIGEFTDFIATVDKNEAIINEPILFSLKIAGKGNLDQILTPKINLPNIFNTYESKTNVQEDYSNGYAPGEKQFEFVIQVNKPGEFKIDEQTFTYFDTNSRQYQTLKTKPIALNITMPPNYSSNEIKQDFQNNQADINNSKTNTEEDIHFIEEDINQISRKENAYITWWLFLFFMLIPISIYFRKSFKPLAKFIKSKKLKKESISKLKKDLENIIRSRESNKIYPLFLNYISTKFNTPQILINETWIENKLKEIGWKQDKINEFVNYLSECAGITFAPTQESKTNYQQLLEKSKYWFLILESNVL